VSARTSVGGGTRACQVVGCRCEASMLPVEVMVASGLLLELAVCPGHADWVVEEFDTVLVGDEEQVA
jgi:hypothetical protein